MNLRLFSIALLISALPTSMAAGSALKPVDFVASERISAEGERVLSVKLSKSGKAKLKKTRNDLPNAKRMAVVQLKSVY